MSRLLKQGTQGLAVKSNIRIIDINHIWESALRRTQRHVTFGGGGKAGEAGRFLVAIGCSHFSGF